MFLSAVPGLESRYLLPGWFSVHYSGYPIPGPVINFANRVRTHCLIVSRRKLDKSSGRLPPFTIYLHLPYFKIRAKQNWPQIGGDICNYMYLAHSALNSTADRDANKEMRCLGTIDSCSGENKMGR